MNKHVSIRATCLKRSALSTTKEGISYSRSIPPVRRARSGTHTPPCGPGVAGASSPSDRAPARSSQIRPFARGTATGPREAVEARGRPTRTDARRPHGCIVHVPAAGWGSPPPRPLTHSTTRVAAPTVSHATGARARPRLRLRSPGRDRVPGRTVPAADTPRRRAAAETATVAGAPAHAAPPGCNVHHTARGRGRDIVLTGHRM
jgi:hypothetical protein